jgi:hypothetical protein
MPYDPLKFKHGVIRDEDLCAGLLRPREARWGDGIYECDGCGRTLAEHLVTEVPGDGPVGLKTLYLCPACIEKRSL